MEDKLLYELEYQLNELRKAKLSEIEYNNMSVKELLDLGFDNCFIKITDNWYNLGYKDIDRINNKIYYESNDFGRLNDKQLSCIISYVNHEISDYNYLQVSVELVNKEDSKLFWEEVENKNE